MMLTTSLPGEYQEAQAATSPVTVAGLRDNDNHDDMKEGER